MHSGSRLARSWGCVLSVCPLFLGHQGGGAGPGAGEARPVNKLFPAPTLPLTPQALPRRKIQLVSSNCFAEEREKGAGKKGDPPSGWCVLGGLGGKQHVIVCAQVPMCPCLFLAQTQPS